MLINQKFAAGNTKGMAYLPRNTGWYRKHFKLPAAWSGKSVWLYFEGSFHATTAFLNGADIGFHEAGYTSFWLRLDNTTVHYGDTENVLALYVDASFGTGWWYLLWGIHMPSDIILQFITPVFGTIYEIYIPGVGMKAVA